MNVRDVMSRDVPALGTPRILDRCPGCASDYLFTVYDGETTNFLCPTCSRCWAVGLGVVHRVDPLTCPGCEWRSTCLARWDCDRR